MPQNVNWAVKGAYASLLLPPTMEMNERPKSNPIANAKWSVVFIENSCRDPGCPSTVLVQ